MRSPFAPWLGSPLLLAATIAGCSVTSPQPDATVTPITTFLASAVSGCPAAHGKTVLIDPTHDGGTWWFPQASSLPSGFDPNAEHQGKALASYFRARGYVVTELGRGATMSRDSLLTYAVVIRAAYAYDDTHPGYSDADIAAYTAVVSCPRTLILVGEYLRPGKQDPLSEVLGVSLTGSVNGNITTFTAHAITAGVSSVPYIAGSFLASENDSAVQVLGRLSTGEAVMGLVTNRIAKIFFIGDINGLEQVPQPLVSNLVVWGF